MATPLTHATLEAATIRTPADEAIFDEFLSMAGAFHDLYERYGGVDAVIREMDEVEEDDSPA